MSGNDTALSEGVVKKLEVGLLEEALGRTLGVGRVSDDDVEGVLEIVEELEAITDVNLGLGVLEALGHVREVLLGEANDSLGRFERQPILDVGDNSKPSMAAQALTSSMSQRMASSTHSCLTTSRRTPPSPPPMTKTFLGLGCEFMAR